MLSFINVGSGSKGNATLIYNEDTLIQIDMGLPLKSIKAALKEIGKSIEDLRAVFITHDHSDHISTLDRLPKTVVRFASEKTINGEYRILFLDECVLIGSMVVQPLKTSHDAINPIGFLIKDNDESLAYITDTGFIPDETLPFLVDATYYIFESNHDYKMLMKSKRPPSLKKRIHSDLGHLSNVDSAFYLSHFIGPKTKEIYLAHLSEECNLPHLAIDAHLKAYKKKRIDVDKIDLVCLKQRSFTKGGHAK